MTSPNRVIIFDTTLRDGEQSPGASMTKDEKLRIAKALERLRTMVQNYAFPQVGQVTVSIGFTAIGCGAPVEVLGQADQALYYAKENGRNQVWCYERLVAEGAVAKPVSGQAVVDGTWRNDLCRTENTPGLDPHTLQALCISEHCPACSVASSKPLPPSAAGILNTAALHNAPPCSNGQNQHSMSTRLRPPAQAPPARPVTAPGPIA